MCLPVCPRCEELNEPDAEWCAGCRGPLTERVAYLNRGRVMRNAHGQFLPLNLPRWAVIDGA